MDKILLSATQVTFPWLLISIRSQLKVKLLYHHITLILHMLNEEIGGDLTLHITPGVQFHT